jgi:hypothetical protein
MDQINLSKILNYENRLFNKFISKRTNLIKTIKEKNIQNKTIFLKNFKNIIDCIESANDYIDNFNLEKTDNESEFILFYFLCKDLFFKTESSSESSSDSDTESSSDSETESCSDESESSSDDSE